MPVWGVAALLYGVLGLVTLVGMRSIARQWNWGVALISAAVWPATWVLAFFFWQMAKADR